MRHLIVCLLCSISCYCYAGDTSVLVETVPAPVNLCSGCNVVRQTLQEYRVRNHIDVQTDIRKEVISKPDVKIDVTPGVEKEITTRTITTTPKVEMFEAPAVSTTRVQPSTVISQVPQQIISQVPQQVITSVAPSVVSNVVSNRRQVGTSVICDLDGCRTVDSGFNPRDMVTRQVQVSRPSILGLFRRCRNGQCRY